MSVHAQGIRRWRAAAVVLGGGLVATGALLPWITLFAGLQHYSGMIGLYGWLVLAGGVASVAIGLAMVKRRARWLPVCGLGLGLTLLLFTIWLVGRLFETMHGLGGDAMLVARPGPGLFVAMAGALIVAIAAALVLVRHGVADELAAVPPG